MCVCVCIRGKYPNKGLVCAVSPDVSVCKSFLITLLPRAVLIQ